VLDKITIDGIEFTVQKRGKRGYIVSYEDYRVGTLFLYIEKLDDLEKIVKLIDNVDFVIALRNAKMVLPTKSLIRLLYRIGKNIDTLISDNEKLKELIIEIQNKVEKHMNLERILEQKEEYIIELLRRAKHRLFDTMIYVNDKQNIIPSSQYGIRIISTKNGEKALLIMTYSCHIKYLDTYLIDTNGDIYYFIPTFIDDKKTINVLYKVIKCLDRREYNKLLKLARKTFYKADNKEYTIYAKYILFIIDNAQKQPIYSDLEVFKIMLGAKLI